MAKAKKDQSPLICINYNPGKKPSIHSIQDIEGFNPGTRGNIYLNPLGDTMKMVCRNNPHTIDRLGWKANIVKYRDLTLGYDYRIIMGYGVNARKLTPWQNKNWKIY